MIDKSILVKYGIKPISYQKKKSVVIVKTIDKSYVFKKRKVNKKSIFEYLYSRNFRYFPNIYNLLEDDEYDIFEYVVNYDIPSYDKALDIMKLMSLLHLKTTHYKENKKDDIKVVYEDILKKIDDLSFYYDRLFKEIDSEIYMSPSSYLLIRNSSKVLAVLDFCKNELDNWYEIVTKKEKIRFSLIHNNLDVSHLLVSNESYLISFDTACEDYPIYDLVTFYFNDGKKYDFSSLFNIYLEHYPLTEEEMKLFFILISLPKKIKLNKDSYTNTLEVKEMLDDIYMTDKFILPYYAGNKSDKEEYF